MSFITCCETWFCSNWRVRVNPRHPAAPPTGWGRTASLFFSHRIFFPLQWQFFYSEMTLFMWCHTASLASYNELRLHTRTETHTHTKKIAGQKKQKEVTGWKGIAVSAMLKTKYGFLLHVLTISGVGGTRASQSLMIRGSNSDLSGAPGGTIKASLIADGDEDGGDNLPFLYKRQDDSFNQGR